MKCAYCMKIEYILNENRNLVDDNSHAVVSISSQMKIIAFQIKKGLGIKSFIHFLGKKITSEDNLQFPLYSVDLAD